MLKLALDELIDNARKFTRSRYPVRIEVSACERNGQKAYFVRDNGVGFDMVHASKLFSLFQHRHGPEFPFRAAEWASPWWSE